MVAHQEDVRSDSSASGSAGEASSEDETGNAERVEKGKEAGTSGRYSSYKDAFAAVLMPMHANQMANCFWMSMHAGWRRSVPKCKLRNRQICHLLTARRTSQ